MKFASIPEFLGFLRTRTAAVEAAQRRGLNDAARLFENTARDMIGEEIPAWPDLALSTLEEKARLGYRGHVSDTDPLLRTGELRASIRGTVDGTRVVLSSDDPIAAFQEFGTERIPPRPFIGSTVCNEAGAAAHLIANEEMGAAMGLSGPLHPTQRRDGERR